jgi:phosphate butyryltransferase
MLTSLKDIVEKAKESGGKKIVVAGAGGPAVMEAVKNAKNQGIMEPILVGDAAEIERAAKDVGLNLEDIQIVDKKDDKETADASVNLIHDQTADGLLKGKVSSATLLKAVLHRKEDLSSGSLLSHVALMEIPTYHKLLAVTDGGMVIQPTLEQKVGILKNGIQIMHKLGIAKPKVAVMAAIEEVNSGMPETEHAAALVKMAEEGEFGDTIVEGPLAVDLAFSPEAARIKNIESRVSGDPDILLMPNIACGNIFSKGLFYLAKGKPAGLVMGAKKPIILLSRADDAETKFNSIALGVVCS